MLGSRKDGGCESTLERRTRKASEDHGSTRMGPQRISEHLTVVKIRDEVPSRVENSTEEVTKSEKGKYFNVLQTVQHPLSPGQSEQHISNPLDISFKSNSSPLDPLYH